MPLPIAQPPFYALPIASYTVRGFAGLKVDTAFHVLDSDEKPITGLYAVGEGLGSNLSGKGGVGRSEEHTSEIQSLMRISYAVFCLKHKTKHNTVYCTTQIPTTN